MNQLILESCVRPWDPNNVYKDKCKRFVSNGHLFMHELLLDWLHVSTL